MEAPCVSLFTRIRTRVLFACWVRDRRVTVTSSMTAVKVAVQRAIPKSVTNPRGMLAVVLTR